MSFAVKIEYTGTDTAVENICAPIAADYCMKGSYIDSPAYVVGNPVDGDDAGSNYGKSVYATNVEGWGELEIPEPFATTSIPSSSPLAQFKLAVVGEDNVVEFTVDTYAEAFYYKQLGEQMADQGFVVTVDSDEDSSDGEPD